MAVSYDKLRNIFREIIQYKREYQFFFDNTFFMQTLEKVILKTIDISREVAEWKCEDYDKRFLDWEKDPNRAHLGAPTLSDFRVGNIKPGDFKYLMQKEIDVIYNNFVTTIPEIENQIKHAAWANLRSLGTEIVFLVPSLFGAGVIKQGAKWGLKPFRKIGAVENVVQKVVVNNEALIRKNAGRISHAVAWQVARAKAWGVPSTMLSHYATNMHNTIAAGEQITQKALGAQKAIFDFVFDRADDAGKKVINDTIDPNAKFVIYPLESKDIGIEDNAWIFDNVVDCIPFGIGTAKSVVDLGRYAVGVMDNFGAFGTLCKIQTRNGYLIIRDIFTALLDGAMVNFFNREDIKRTLTIHLSPELTAEQRKQKIDFTISYAKTLFF